MLTVYDGRETPWEKESNSKFVFLAPLIFGCTQWTLVDNSSTLKSSKTLMALWL
ncbi:hypothetical protein MANES_12G041760v8 [Manihot esculenta]|uniref:Uncharacterized protein n=1 Tax=Manihot esculenta TaxID=3983 RepID=A0ACB7GT51_MANES|nr:hypothetical protein MANES_12G041760v8 [Manihot esculenta]